MSPSSTFTCCGAESGHLPRPSQKESSCQPEGSIVATSQMEDVSLDPQFAELFTILRTHEWALHVDRLSLSGEPATSPVLLTAALGGAWRWCCGSRAFLGRSHVAVLCCPHSVLSESLCWCLLRVFMSVLMSDFDL